MSMKLKMMFEIIINNNCSYKNINKRINTKTKFINKKRTFEYMIWRTNIWRTNRINKEVMTELFEYTIRIHN